MPKNDPPPIRGRPPSAVAQKRVKFTTKLDAKLLDRARIFALRKKLQLNELIETALKGHLSGRKQE